MMKKLVLGFLVVFFVFGFMGIANATAILTQTPQGTYADNLLGGSRWSTFTGMINTQHTITEVADFENSPLLLGYDAIWVDQELGQTLTTNEISSLQNYFTSSNTEALVILDSNWNENTYLPSSNNNIFAQNIVDWLADTSTKKLVLIGENNSWDSWNQSIMDVVGGGFNSDCSRLTGGPTSTHFLTTGLGTVENICGSTIDISVGNPEILFANNMAAVYGSTPSVPEPATMLLLGTGLIGLAGLRRKYKK